MPKPSATASSCSCRTDKSRFSRYKAHQDFLSWCAYGSVPVPILTPVVVCHCLRHARLRFLCRFVLSHLLRLWCRLVLRCRLVILCRFVLSHLLRLWCRLVLRCGLVILHRFMLHHRLRLRRGLVMHHNGLWCRLVVYYHGCRCRLMMHHHMLRCGLMMYHHRRGCHHGMAADAAGIVAEFKSKVVAAAEGGHDHHGHQYHLKGILVHVRRDRVLCLYINTAHQLESFI